MKAIFTFILILIFFSCETKNKSSREFNNEEKILIDELNKYNYVDNDCIGWNCDTTDLFRLFIKMQNQFGDNELTTLTEHSNPAIRVYSFWALCKRKIPSFKTVLDEHIKDTVQFMYNSNDEGAHYQVNEFYLTLVDPSATVFGDCIKLSVDDTKKYKNLIK